MKERKLLPPQLKAIAAIQKALKKNQKHIVVELPSQFGFNSILSKTVENIINSSSGKILVITANLYTKEQLENMFSDINSSDTKTNDQNIVIKTENHLLFNQYGLTSEYDFIILYSDIVLQKETYKAISRETKKTIIFLTINNNSQNLFPPEDIVFSYSVQQALKDGYLTPAMDSKVLEPAIILFSQQLLESFGYYEIKYPSNISDCNCDLIVQKDNKRIYVECKSYKSQVVSPSAANSLLHSIVMKRRMERIPKDDIILLIVLSNIPSFEKDVIFDRYQTIVWDIENLVFYSKNDPVLLKLLSQITYFPIDHIEGKCFEKSDSVGLKLPAEEEITEDLANKTDKSEELLKKLNNCKAGTAQATEYEEICEEIIRYLFEANYFNLLTSQHKTNDEHFRMDLIGSLKTNQTNENNMHPLWRMLVEHYNSHFVVFEFKNYSTEIDQNLIYITEKYLFDAALRNVAIIISRNGFSNSAKFAAEGCLKEHRKLILNITNDDLKEMLKLKSDKAADYVLDKLESFLMGISK